MIEIRCKKCNKKAVEVWDTTIGNVRWPCKGCGHYNIFKLDKRTKSVVG